MTVATQTGEERIMSALGGLAPIPVSKPPVDGDAETYVVINETLGQYVAPVSNRARRLSHQYQVHVYSRLHDGSHRTVMDMAIVLLQGAGIHVAAYGPDTYEEDTGKHHIAITCGWADRIE